MQPHDKRNRTATIIENILLMIITVLDSFFFAHIHLYLSDHPGGINTVQGPDIFRLLDFGGVCFAS